jgi:hypothetical protein
LSRRLDVRAIANITQALASSGRLRVQKRVLAAEHSHTPMVEQIPQAALASASCLHAVLGPLTHSGDHATLYWQTFS